MYVQSSLIIMSHDPCRWLLCSPLAEEVNLDDNWVGEAAGRELVSVLQLRKDGTSTKISFKHILRGTENFLRTLYFSFFGYYLMIFLQ